MKLKFTHIVRRLTAIFLLLFPMLFIPKTNGQSVKWEPTIREIIISTKDSTTRAQILIPNKRIKTKDELMYYWYAQDRIHKNMGNYSGSLLHGDYSVLNHERNMIAKGTYAYGLKHGDWLQWDAQGMLIKKLEYNYGVLNGEICFYDKQGNLEKIWKYKNGELVAVTYMEEEKTKNEGKKEESSEEPFWKFLLKFNKTENDSVRIDDQETSK